MSTDTARCFRSGNTLRISLTTYIRRWLHAEPGDVLRIESQSDGHATISNLSHEERTRTKRKTK